MQTKSRAMEKMYHNPEEIDKIFDQRPEEFDYGNLSKLPLLMNHIHWL